MRHDITRHDRHDTARRGAARHGTVRHGTARHCTTRHDRLPACACASGARVSGDHEDVLRSPRQPGRPRGRRPRRPLCRSEARAAGRSRPGGTRGAAAERLLVLGRRRTRRCQLIGHCLLLLAPVRSGGLRGSLPARCRRRRHLRRVRRSPRTLRRAPSPRRPPVRRRSEVPKGLDARGGLLCDMIQ